MAHPQPGQAEELLWETWLMLLQLQGLVVEMLIRSDGAQLKAEQGPEESYQEGPSGSLSA